MNWSHFGCRTIFKRCLSIRIKYLPIAASSRVSSIARRAPIGFNSTLFRPFFVQFSTSTNLHPDKITEAEYDRLADETLDSLQEYFDKLGDSLDANIVGQEYDVSYSQGVLTVNLGGSNVGRTYVINKQTPNKQIWFSSPFSGPKRYDFVNNRWIYLHDGGCLHDLLQDEFKSALKTDRIDFSQCSYAK